VSPRKKKLSIFFCALIHQPGLLVNHAHSGPLQFLHTAMWKNRSSALHGSTIEEQATKLLQCLNGRTNLHCNSFVADVLYTLSCHYTLAQHLLHSYNNLIQVNKPEHFFNFMYLSSGPEIRGFSESCLAILKLSASPLHLMSLTPLSHHFNFLMKSLFPQ
jgi:hypothetical protein